MLYFAERISENRALTAEGYLICRGVPVARSGTQEYWPEELGLPPGDAPLPVERPEEEVFSPECIASFESKPVTEDHPDLPDGVTAETIHAFQKGHAQNLRRGAGAESHLLLADLVITDPETIRHIQEGKREISCGYSYVLCEENGRYVQRNIRGNHIAVVDKGRAGPRVCIKDQQIMKRARTAHEIRSHMPMKNTVRKPVRKAGVPSALIRRLIAGALKANDIAPEDMPEVVELMNAVSEPEAPLVEITVTGDPAEPETPETPAEEPELLPAEDDEDGVLSRLDRIISLLEALVTPPALDEDPADPLEEELTELLESPEAESVTPSEFLEASAGAFETIEGEQPAEEETRETADRMVRSVVRALKPMIAALPKSYRKPAADAALLALRRSLAAPRAARHAGDRGAYASLAGAARRKDPADLGRRIMASRNVNCRTR